MEQILVPVESNLGIDPRKLAKAIGHLPAKQGVTFGGALQTADWLKQFATAIAGIADSIMVYPIGDGKAVVMTADTRNQSTLLSCDKTDTSGQPIELALRRGAVLPEKIGKADAAIVNWLLKATDKNMPHTAGVQIEDGIAFTTDGKNAHACPVPGPLASADGYVLPAIRGGILSVEKIDPDGTLPKARDLILTETERAIVQAGVLRACILRAQTVKITVGETAVSLPVKVIESGLKLAKDNEFVVMSFHMQDGIAPIISLGRPNWATLHSCSAARHTEDKDNWTGVATSTQQGPVSQRIEIQTSHGDRNFMERHVIVEPDGNPIPAVTTFQWRNQ